MLHYKTKMRIIFEQIVYTTMMGMMGGSTSRE